MKYHQIDNFLVKKYLINSKLTDELHGSLIDWHLALNKENEESCRITALKFLKIYTANNIDIINGEPQFAEKVISIYEPLEKLLKIAISIRKKDMVRDHLNHTVRNILLSDFLLNNNQSVTKLEQQILTLAAIFHDFAYPIQKLKAVSTNIIDETLGTFLNSHGKIAFSIDDPDNLIDLLHYYGSLANNNQGYKQETKEKINLLFTKILYPAIAGQGLFEAPHSLSSCVMLLILVKDIQLHQNQLENLLDICFAIAYHDRERNISELGDKLSKPIAFLRIADELQEWDRDITDYSFVEDVTIERNSFFEFNFKMKNRNIDGKIESCDGQRNILDKIQGILPVKKYLPIKLNYIFPQTINNGEFNDLFAKYNGEMNVVGSIAEGSRISVAFDEKLQFKIHNDELLA